MDVPALPAFEQVEERHFGRDYKLERLVEMVLVLSDRINSRAGRERIRQAVKEHALSGPRGEAEALAAAQTWFDGDWALRELMVECRQAGKPLSTALAAYYDAAMFRPVTPAGEGKRDAFLDTVMRDLAICLLVPWIGALWPGLKFTRSPATKHRESACSLLAEAMTRAGFPLSEGQIQKIYGQRASGIVERLTALMPPLAQN